MTRSLLTRKALAAALDSHARTIAKFERAGMPCAVLGRSGKPSMYDEAACRAWLEDYQETLAARRRNFDEARAQKGHWQALLNKQAFETRAKRLLPADEVRKAGAAMRSDIRARLGKVPRQLAPALVAASATEGSAAIERLLAEALRGVLTDLAAGEPFR